MKKWQINWQLIKIFCSLVLIVLGCVFNNTFLYMASYIIVAYDVYLNAFKNILQKEFFDENILMIIATIGAFYIGEFPEGVMVMLLFQIGEYLSFLATNRTKKSITALLDLRSDYVTLKSGKIPVEEAKVGEIFIVKPGEKIPLDGTIIKGTSNIDTSMLTGESIPQKVGKNNTVLSGTINLNGLLEIRATKTFETSTASKIIEMMENSNETKSKSEKFIMRFSKIYTPIVVILALLLILVPTMMGLDFNVWLYRALEFLVISCPCALVISVPLGFFCGIGKCSQEGILVKNSNDLDNLTKIDAFMFDKTGTLTKGVFEVTNINNTSKITKEELLKIAAYAEANSNHPISKSIINKYNKKINFAEISSFQEKSGEGLTCKINSDLIIIGTEKLLKENKIKGIESKNNVGTIIHVARNKEYLGSIVISDIIKPEAIKAINQLKKLRIKEFYIISGDNLNVVQNVANALGINNYFSNLLPLEKVAKLKLIKQNQFIAFVGDGINDAPVIKLADIGIAMGNLGSDAAIEAADIILMHDNLRIYQRL